MLVKEGLLWLPSDILEFFELLGMFVLVSVLSYVFLILKTYWYFRDRFLLNKIKNFKT